MSRTIGLVQARLNSSRLPGKMLYELSGEPVLALLLKRLGASAQMDEIVVTTPDADHAIVGLCRELGVSCFSGPENDVLQRMWSGAREARADVVVRICGDNPVMDSSFVDGVIQIQKERGGYVGAVPGFSKGLPAGLAAEAFPMSALDMAQSMDRTDEGREHVTPFIRRGMANIPVHYMPIDAGRDYSHLRLCLDTPEDYTLLRSLFAHFGAHSFSWLEALEHINATPHLRAINEDVEQRGLKKLGAFDRLEQKNAFDGNLMDGGVRSFNRATHRDAHMSRRKETVSRYLNPDNGELLGELSRHRCCPLCGADLPELLFDKEGFLHQRCQSCSMIYVSPCLAEEKLHSHAMSEESWFKVLNNPTQLELDRRKFAFGLDALEALLPERKQCIDIGCGPGVFLTEARKRGWDVHGVEFNAYCQDLLEEQGIPVTSTPLHEATLPVESFSAASAWDVLEHVLDPIGFVQEVNKLLEPGGVFLVAVPNVGSLVSRVLHGASATFAGESHVNFFNIETLTALLENCGFTVVHAETYLTELGTISNHLNYENPYLGNSEPILECLTPEFIHDNMLGSRLLTLARKEEG